MLRILIVDDEIIILEGIQRVIQEDLELTFQTEIVTASNALEAINVLGSFEADLIITDIMLSCQEVVRICF